MITSAHGTLLRLNAQSFSTSEQVLECYDRIPKYSRSRSSHITPQPLIMGAHLRWKSFLAEAGVWWVGALGYFSRGLRLRKRRPGGTFTVGGAPAPRVTAQGIRTNYIMGPRKRFIEFCYDTCLRFSVCTHFGNPAARAAATGNNDTRLSLDSSSPVRQIRERHLT